jgi:hypothetical protein
MDALVDIFEPTEELPVPGPDEVRFNVLTHQGRRTASAMYDDVAQPAHSIHPLFATAQDVLTELRLIDEGTRG